MKGLFKRLHVMSAFPYCTARLEVPALLPVTASWHCEHWEADCSSNLDPCHPQGRSRMNSRLLAAACGVRLLWMSGE